MKLHLPKALFTAVMALFAVSQTVWATWSANRETDGYAYYYDQDNGNNGTIDTLTLPTADNGVQIDNSSDYFTADDKFVKLYICAGYGGESKPEGYDGQTSTINKLEAAAGQEINITINPWQDWKFYKLLTIGNLEIGGGTGSAGLIIDSNQSVQLNAVSGTLSSVNVKGSLTSKAAIDLSTLSGNGQFTVDFNAGTNTITNLGSFTGSLTVGSGGIMTLGNQTANTLGGIQVDGGSLTLKRVDAQLNKSVSVTNSGTLTIGDTDLINSDNTSNLTISVDSSTLAIGSQRFVLGLTHTLTLNNANVTGAGSAHGAIDLAKSSSNGAAGTHTITSTGVSTIEGVVRVRDGNTVKFNVVDSTDTLTVKSLSKGNGNNSSSLVKAGAGKLVIQSLAGSQQEAFIKGTTTLEAGAIEYAIDKINETSTNDGSYDGVITGTGNIIKSGTGTITFADITNLDGDITVSGGTLNISSLTANKTIDISTTGGTLNITDVILDMNTMALTEKTGSSGTQYYSIDGGTTQNNVGNGFLYTSGDYVLFTNYVWEGDVGEDMTITNDGTNTYVSTAGTPGTTFYVSDGALQINAATIGAESYAVKGGTMNISGTMNGSDIEYTSGAITLADADATLVLDSADNAAQLLSTVTGTNGTIKVTANTTMTDAAQAGGKLVVEGATLTANPGKTANNAYLNSFSSIELDNATIQYHGNNTTLRSVTVNNGGATLRIKDMDAGGIVTLAETTTLNGALTIESKGWAGTNEGEKSWKYIVDIKELTGDGNLIVKGNNSQQNETNKVNVKLLDTYEGTITVNRLTNGTTSLIATADGDINLSGLNISGGATVDLSGVVGTKNLGTVNVGADTNLALSGVIGNMAATGDGGISMADGTSITGTVSIANALTIAGTISNTGNVTLSGNVTIAEIASLQRSGTVTYSDNGGTDGYLSAAEYFVVESTGSGTATVTNGMKLNNLYDISVKDDSLVVNINNDDPSGAYYVNNTVNYGGDGSSTQIMEDTTTGITMNGGTLNLNTDLAEGVAISTVKSGSTINIAAGVTLDNSAVTPGDVKSTLTGVAATDSTEASVYNMGVASMNGGTNSANNETKLNVAIGEGWKGTVVFEEGSSFKDNNFDLNDYGVAGSTIQFNGTATLSYLGQGTDNEATYVADIELKGDGFSIENGFSGSTYTFTGAFKGDGTFAMNKGAMKGQSYIFSGDMSKWTGELKQDATATAGFDYTYTFNEKATNIANKVTAASGTMVVNVDNSEAVTMTGDVTATGGTMKLTKTGASKLTVDNIAANGGNVVLAGKGANAIEVGNMSIASGNTVTGAADVTVTNTLTINSSNAISLDGALVLTDATVDLSGFTLDTTTEQDTYVFTLGTAAGGINPDDPDATNISFTGINVDGYTATLAAMATVPTAGAAMLADASATNNYLVLTLVKDTVTPPPATELTQVMVTGEQGYDSADNVLTLTTNIANIADYSGIASTLAATVTDSLWEQLVKKYGIGTLVNIALVDGAGNYFDLDGADNEGKGDDVALTINGIGVNAPAPTYSAVGNGAAVGPYVTSYIPEPTTGTLSILALAGLMIRRRRR